MTPVINVRHVEDKTLHLEGELETQELNLGIEDELVQPGGPAQYVIDVELNNTSLLVQGRLKMPLICQCSRCLKSFKSEVLFEAYSALIPLEGEEAALVENDLVDLTPVIREDILLAFPQHPLCDSDCAGLPVLNSGLKKAKPGNQPKNMGSTWAELNKLKF